MSDATKSKITKEMVKKAIEDKVINGNGHSIYEGGHYADAGFDCGHLVQVHESDGSMKGSITGPDGKIVDELKGIYSLDFHYWVAGEIGLTHSDYGTFFGRGSQARAIMDALKKWADSPDEMDDKSAK
tara:strand:- start:39 stop:422 length:384 start_codon:yes stop_codon:yes gene_type:complete